MKRSILFVLLAAAAPAGAQMLEEPPPRLEITPFMGWRFGYTTQAEQVVFDEDESVFIFQEEEVSSGTLYGVDAVYNVWGPWSATAAVAYGPGTNIVVTQETETEQDLFGVEGRSTMFFKAGAQFKLPEPEPLRDQRLHRPSAFLFAGPAVVRVTPPDLVPGAPDYLNDAYYQFALNLGFRATGQVPWWDNVGYMFSLEDFLTVWNDEELASREERFFQEQGFTGVQSQIDQDATHIFAFRAGLTWQIGELR